MKGGGDRDNSGKREICPGCQVTETWRGVPVAFSTSGTC